MRRASPGRPVCRDFGLCPPFLSVLLSLSQESLVQFFVCHTVLSQEGLVRDTGVRVGIHLPISEIYTHIPGFLFPALLYLAEGENSAAEGPKKIRNGLFWLASTKEGGKPWGGMR